MRLWRKGRNQMAMKKKFNLPKLNEKQKKILNISITVAQVILVLFAVIASIIILANPSGATIRQKGTTLMPVLSDSMVGEAKDNFKTGDLLVIHAPNTKKYDTSALEVGTIITFESIIQGQKVYVTHRIVEVEWIETTGSNYYYTKGDANVLRDTVPIKADKVLGIYTGKMVGVGKTITFLQTPVNFLLAILLPLALLFIYNIVLFVKMLMDQKLAKVQAGIPGELTAEEEEARKQKVIDEYLASQSLSNIKKVDESNSDPEQDA